ncbi:MAG TPA: 4-hydroxy-tetrahydrodipicolinate synthase [Acidimicrobiales bacterium]|nr:4-hydroxy-tetrahydrodipicolinate synthase [Acidimicrobiales bacterium]
MSAIPGRFGAVLTAMATPFNADGSLDLDGAQTLAKYLVEHGNDGIVVAGTTGEAPTLTDDEQRDLCRAVREAVTVPVIAGATSNDTAHSVHLTKAITATAVDAILAQTPYYNRPSQAGISAHFRAIAAATELPVMLYDIPIRTGRKIAHDTLVELSRDVPNIVAVKDAVSDPALSAALVAAAPSLELYSGEDKMTLALLAVGACGTVSVASHWNGLQQAEMLAAFAKGDVQTAREINARLIESWDFEGSEAAPNPIPTKAMLRVMGLPGGPCRLPMGPEPAGLEARAREVLANLGG